MIEEDARIDAQAFRVYAHYRRWAGDNGAFQRGRRETARMCRLSLTTVAVATDALREAGYITVQPILRGKQWVESIRTTNIWEQNREHFTRNAILPDNAILEWNALLPSNGRDTTRYRVGGLRDTGMDHKEELDDLRTLEKQDEDDAHAPAQPEPETAQDGELGPLFPPTADTTGTGETETGTAPHPTTTSKTVTSTPRQSRRRNGAQSQMIGEQPAGTKRKPTIEEITADLIATYAGRWTPEQVRDKVAKALNHKASTKWIDVGLGLKGWLRRDSEGEGDLPAPVYRNGVNGTGPLHTNGVAPPVRVMSEFEVWANGGKPL